MPTIVEVALSRIEDLASRGFGQAAAAWTSNAPKFFSLTDQASIGHRYNTPLVNILINADAELKNNSWFVTSYPPTAACIGMANLLGYKRIVYRDRTGQPHSFDVTAMTAGPPNQAFLAQFDNTNYPAAALGAGDCGRSLAASGPVPRQASFEFTGPVQSLISDLQGADETVRDNCGVLLAYAIVYAVHGNLNDNQNRHADFRGQNIGSVMVDENYRLLRWGLNTNKANRTFHGETSTVQMYQRSNGFNPLPANARLFTTLEPCAMCSGILVHCAGSNQFTVVSGQKDNQVKVETALRKGGRTDGETGNYRRVPMIYANLPILPGVKFADHLSYEQLRLTPKPPPNSPPSPKGGAANPKGGAARPQAAAAPALMQTTVYLESPDAKATFGDAVIMLDKLASLWVPQINRPAWRDNLLKFLLSVKATMGR